MSPLNRRRFLQGSAVAGAAAALGTGLARPERAGAGETASAKPYPTLLPLPFAHGVASGDPLADRVILWTRVTGATGASVPVDWEVRTDPAMTSPVVARGTVTTDASRDWTVKVDAGGLQPQTTYYYRFTALGQTSITGRTRTAVAGAVDELRFVVVSCASYWSVVRWDGMRRIAERNDVDLVVHCGDHLYDYPDEDEWVRGSMDPTDVDFRSWESLAELRRRYAFYYADPDFAALHQQHPLFVLWDNHDLSNGDNQPPTITDAEVVQAFWEWTPARPPRGDGSGTFPPAPASSVNVTPEDTAYVYRSLPYGPLADLRCWDVRKIATPAERKAGSVLGATQRAWVERSLQSSTAAWRLIVNGNPFGQFATDSPVVAQVTGSRNPVPSDYGAWDEYPAERAALVQMLRTHGITDNLILTGDAHGSFLWDVTDDDTLPAYDPATGRSATGAVSSVGVEFLPTSLGRGGATETLAAIGYMQAHGGQHPYADRAGFQPYLDGAVAATVPFDAAVQSQNPSMQYLEWSQHGYGLVHLTSAKAVFELWWQPIRTYSDTDALGAQFQTLRGADHVTQVVPASATSGSRVSAPAPPFDGPTATLPDATTPVALVAAGAAVVAGAVAVARSRRG